MQRTVRKEHGGVFSAGTLAAGMIMASLSLAHADRAQAQCMYEVVATFQGPECPPFGPSAVVPTAINDHGVVVGYFISCGTSPARPFMWSQETGFVAIQLPAGVARAEPEDINNHGQIVGTLLPTGPSGVRAFLLDNGVWTTLPPTGNGLNSGANAINDDGWVCGYRDTAAGRTAIRWRGDVVEELASPIGGGAVAFDISAPGVATGRFGSGTTSGIAFVWTADEAMMLPVLQDAVQSRGNAINSKGAIAGAATLGSSEGPAVGRPWFFDEDLFNLGVLPGLVHGTTTDVHDANLVVGTCSSANGGDRTPFVWQSDPLIDLRTLIVSDLPDGVLLGSARGINRHGQIVMSDRSDTVVFIVAPLDQALGDVNIDCVVDERDIVAVLEGWGPDRLGHIADIVTSSNLQPPGDGSVDGADLAVVLGNWSFSTEASAPKRRR